MHAPVLFNRGHCCYPGRHDGFTALGSDTVAVPRCSQTDVYSMLSKLSVLTIRVMSVKFGTAVELCTVVGNRQSIYRENHFSPRGFNVQIAC